MTQSAYLHAPAAALFKTLSLQARPILHSHVLNQASVQAALPRFICMVRHAGSTVSHKVHSCLSQCLRSCTGVLQKKPDMIAFKELKGALQTPLDALGHILRRVPRHALQQQGRASHPRPAHIHLCGHSVKVRPSADGSNCGCQHCSMNTQATSLATGSCCWQAAVSCVKHMIRSRS